MLHIEAHRNQPNPLTIVIPTSQRFASVYDQELHKSLQHFLLGKPAYGLQFLRRTPLEGKELPVEVTCRRGNITSSYFSEHKDGYLPTFTVQYQDAEEVHEVPFQLHQTKDKRRFFREAQTYTQQAPVPALVSTMRQGDLELLLRRRQIPKNRRRSYGSFQWYLSCQHEHIEQVVSVTPDLSGVWEQEYLPHLLGYHQEE